MKESIEYIKKYKLLLLIIVPAFFLYLLVIFPSGSYYCFEGQCGYYFWGAHGRDAIWHLAIAEISFDKIPFIAPTFAGERLYGYNWLLDFIIFLLARLGVPSIISYFKLLPIAWFIIFTILLIVLARKIKDTIFFVGLFLFLSYFAGSFSYLLTFYHNKTIQNSSTLLSQPVIHTMSNLQYAFSLLFFLSLLILIKDREFNLKKILTSGIIIFFMLGLKFYGGLLSIFLLSIYLILNILKTKLKNFLLYCFVISTFVLLGIFLFYDPLASFKTGSTFGFAPFALVHTITESPDQFYLQTMTDARYYLQQFGIGPRLVMIESLNLAIFLFFYLGTRFFGLLYVVVLFFRRKLGKFDASVILTTYFSIFLTVMLVQKGEWWNTIQFFFYAIFLLTIYLAKLVYDLFQKKQKILLLIGLIIIFLSLPTSYDVFWHFLRVSRPAYLSEEEIKALSFLKNQPDGVVFGPFHKEDQMFLTKTIPLNSYKDSSYVAAFSGKQLYFAEAQTLSVTSVSYESRLERIRKLDCSMLNEIDYVYEIKSFSNSEKIMKKCKPTYSKKVFENKAVLIYSLIRS